MVQQEQNSQDTDYRVRKFLNTVPHLEFSDKGLQNIANRFNISPEQLKALISIEERGNSK